jgi:hypothetical protein
MRSVSEEAGAASAYWLRFGNVNTSQVIALSQAPAAPKGGSMRSSIDWRPRSRHPRPPPAACHHKLPQRPRAAFAARIATLPGVTLA